MEFVLRNLDISIKLCIDHGYEYFITGGALGFDTLAACRVIASRKRYGKIKLIIAVPFRGQADKWSIRDFKLYRALLGMADDVVYLNEFYTNRCYLERNDWMLKKSSVCIAYMTKSSGGTAYTVKNAVNSGHAVCNLARLPFRGINFPASGKVQ